MSRKTIYKKVKHTLDSGSDYDDDVGYMGMTLREKIDDIISSTKNKYKDYKLVRLISVILPGEIEQDKTEYNYPFREFEDFNFYNNFEYQIFPHNEFVAKIGFVFEK